MQYARQASTCADRVITKAFVLEAHATQAEELHEALARLAQIQETLSATQTTLARVTAERDKLRRAYDQLKEHLDLLRRRIFHAKSERIDVAQLEIEFEQMANLTL